VLVFEHLVKNASILLFYYTRSW